MITNDKLVIRTIQIGMLVALFGAWYLATRSGGTLKLFLPAPELVWREMGVLVRSGQLWSSLYVTLASIAKAYVIAVVAGIAVGFAVARSRTLVHMFEPVLSGMFAVPLTMFFPLFVLFFGIGPDSKVAYGATYAFFPIALNTIAGLANVESRYINAAKSMGFSRFGTFRHVLFPAAFPVIITGLRIGFFICFASVLGGETISSVSGVGRYIALAAELMEPARMFAWITVVIVTAMVLNGVVSVLENRMRRASP